MSANCAVMLKFYVVDCCQVVVPRGVHTMFRESMSLPAGHLTPAALMQLGTDSNSQFAVWLGKCRERKSSSFSLFEEIQLTKLAFCIFPRVSRN